MQVPDGLAWWREMPGGGEWLAALPGIAAEYAEQRDPDPRARIRRRLDQLAEELALDRERLRGWAIVHAVAWGGEPGGDWYADMVACAGWLADAA
jgi:Aminoglycoside/hydroxyurea antibiotic resistance kinase